MAWNRSGFDSPWVHKYRNEVIFGVVFFALGQRKPLILGHAAPLLGGGRGGGGKKKEKFFGGGDFWREDFLEGNANAELQMPESICKGPRLLDTEWKCG